LNKKFVNILGSDLFESSVRVKTEMLKSKKSFSSVNDFIFSFNLNFNKKVGGLSARNLLINEFFFKFRLGETSRRMLTTTRGLILPDFTLIKAYVTGCDVIHS
jgi:hypothetical protein